MTTVIDPGDPRAVAATEAIRSGAPDRLRQLLADNPELATAAVGTAGGTRTLMHVATDWPGHYPNVAAVIDTLIQAGADVNGRIRPTRRDATALGSLQRRRRGTRRPARRRRDHRGRRSRHRRRHTPRRRGRLQTVAHRATTGRARRVRQALHAAALGHLDQVRDHLAHDPPPGDITAAFRAACHGGQQATAEHLLRHGADLNWIAPWDGLTPLDAARRSQADALTAWLTARGARSADTET